VEAGFPDVEATSVATWVPLPGGRHSHMHATWRKACRALSMIARLPPMIVATRPVNATGTLEPGGRGDR
jgi:hypothetical protein